MIKAIDGVSLQINDREMVAIIGASGSGKTTLLNIIGCLDKPTNGKYFIDDIDVGKCSFTALAHLRNSFFGYVIQDFAIVPDWNVFENVELPLIYAKKTKAHRKEIVDDILDQLGIYDKKNQSTKNLSGGQKQRVAIASALVNDPRVILTDEPTGALDSATGLDVVRILQDVNMRGRSVIIVTHNPQIAQACDRIIEIRDGRLVQ